MERRIATSPGSFTSARLRDFWLPALTILLISLAFAPIKQFYLAWIALVPWLVFIRKFRRARWAFLINLLIGWALSAINMAWLTPVTWGGMLALTFYMAMYWGFAALILRGVGWRNDVLIRGWHIAAAALIWPGLDFARGNLLSGIPWLYLGHTQSPNLWMIQIADIFGVYGVSALLVAVNMLIAAVIIERRVRAIPTAVMSGIVIVTSIYGAIRIHQTQTSPGPRVMLIQSNYPQSNTGEKGATRTELIDFHLRVTQAALQREKEAGRSVDLVAWSETMMPPINPEAIEAGMQLIERGATSSIGEFWQHTFDRIAEMAKQYQAEFLVGAYYNSKFQEHGGGIVARDQRNSAFLINRNGTLDQLRYDKIHLVPFGEYVPFKQSIPWLYKILTSLAPQGYDYTLSFGDESALRPFRLNDEKRERFFSPICFEDVDSRLIEKMFRAENASKRGDFLVSLTNDGWFARQQLHQHLQIAIFRSIENRVPSARAVNTGISAVIDSCGRVTQSLPPQIEGVLTAQLQLDPRTTFYTRFGDLFAWLCVAVTIGSIVWGVIQWRKRKLASPST